MDSIGLKNDKALAFGKRTLIMGILNVTPDSFSDGGFFWGTDNAVAQGLQMVEDGADIIDIGGESTRPFAERVSIEEEIRRVVPVIEKLRQKTSVPISIDTTKEKVAGLALAAGASIINDVSALRFDDDMGKLAAADGVPVILMHMKGNPRTMQLNPEYDDILSEVKNFLADAVNRAVQYGIDRKRLIIDPGIGFGKTVRNNLKLINNLDCFSSMGVPVLIGPSRKAFIRKILSENPDQDMDPQSAAVEIGTQAVIAASILKGAQIVRVHDVKNTLMTAKLIDAMQMAQVIS
jgi:dihydropteroate synthase